MPMDIRNFFGAKPKDSSKAKGAAAAPAPAAKAPPASKSNGAVRRGQVSQDTTSTNGKGKEKKEQEDQKQPKMGVKSNAQQKKRLAIEDDSESEQEDGGKKQPVEKAKETPKKKQKEAPPASTSKRQSSRTTKKIKEEDEDEEMFHPNDHSDNDEDNDDDVEFVAESKPKRRTDTPRSSSLKVNTKRRAVNDDDEDDEDADVVESPSPTRRTSPRKKTKTEDPVPSATKRAAPPSSTKKKAGPAAPARDPPLKPTQTASSIDTDRLASECLAGYTFVFTGVLDNLGREDSEEMIKVLGGRITSAVSGKTDYLVVGPELEDGRPYTEGSKYKKAVEKGIQLIMGTEALYGLIQQYNKKVRAERGETDIKDENEDNDNSNNKNGSGKDHLKPPPTTSSAAGVIKNPYAKKIVSNPYAKNKPRSSDASVSIDERKPAASTSHSSSAATKQNSNNSDGGSNPLWVDKYKPESSQEILGNQDAVRKLSSWLKAWEDRFNNTNSYGKAFSNPQGPWKAALLSGPPGIGKTTTATLVAKESGRDVIEFNASDVRSKSALKDDLGDITGSQTLNFGVKKFSKPQKRCIIMDEVDGMGGGDRGGVSELIQMIKHSRVPIICICNDRQSQKLKSLIPYCMDLRYKRPMKNTIATRAMEIAAKEGLTVERNAAEAITESCGNDIRQVVNCLQMWSSNKRSNNRMTYKDLKEREHSINKDEILRVSLFDACKQIVEGRRNLSNADAKTERDSFFKRNDAYFVDYNFAGLLVQQNYLKVVSNRFNYAKTGNDTTATTTDILEDMYSAAESMSSFAHAENSLRSEQNWSLLPFTAMLTVKTGFHAGGPNGGFLPGFPEFTAWLGKNSATGKKKRLLQELRHHTNYKISGATEEMRLSYLPVFRDRFLSLLKEEDNVEGAIQLMDEYGFDRDDVFEKLDEFGMDSKAPTFANLESRKKAAFTRAYNEGIHKSQALVAEQGKTTKSKRGGGGGGGQGLLGDPDAIDDDNVPEEDEEEVEEEDDEEKIKAAFTKKKRGRAAGGTAAKGKGAKATKTTARKTKK